MKNVRRNNSALDALEEQYDTLYAENCDLKEQLSQSQSVEFDQASHTARISCGCLDKVKMNWIKLLSPIKQKWKSCGQLNVMTNIWQLSY